MDPLVILDITAPTPIMVKPAADAFAKLRRIVINGCGLDFLAKCGDVMRPAGFRSAKDGVANRSWHKTGRAFDYDQTHKALVIVSEPGEGRQYFRTYLRCVDQTGKQGDKRRVRDMRGFGVDAFLFDFTAAADGCKFTRIPAWNGWPTHYNRREFWHYQFNPDGLTWAAAMDRLSANSTRPTRNGDKVLGSNDRGDAVREIQTRLNELGLLPVNEIDGIFGQKTYKAVAAFQTAKGLQADGKVGPATRKALGL